MQYVEFMIVSERYDDNGGLKLKVLQYLSS